MGLFTRTKRSSTSSSAASTPSNSGSTTPTTANTSTTILSTSPTFPAPLTKTSSRLSLTKTLTWGKKSQEEKYRRRIESWEREDQNEWAAPSARKQGKGRKLCKKDQDVLRAFQWSACERSSMEGGRSRSVFSGISPGCSRMPSVDLGRVALGESMLRREESDTSSNSSEGSS